MKELKHPLTALALCFALAGCREHGHSSHSEHSGAASQPVPSATVSQPLPTTTAPTNPVQHEMQLLTGTLERAVRAIGLGDVRGIAHDLHQVHGAKEATEAAIREGKYRPPLNPDHIDRFLALDEVFHGHLERLVKASNANDVAGAAAAFASTMQSCQGCHTEFRK